MDSIEIDGEQGSLTRLKNKDGFDRDRIEI